MSSTLEVSFKKRIDYHLGRGEEEGVRIVLPKGKEIDLIKCQSHCQPFKTACESEAGHPVCLLSRDSASHSTSLSHLLIILLFPGMFLYPMGRHENERSLETNYIEFVLREI